MVSLLGVLATKVPYHLTIYSIAFGGSAFYSFFASTIAFKVLKREEFGKLQNSVFPKYFIGQTIAPILLALTSPLKVCPFTGTLYALSSIGGALNYFYFLPVCRRLKDQRQTLIDQKLDSIDGVETEEFKKLSKKFGMFHGFSMLANLTSILALGVYGLALSRRLV